MKSIFHNVTLCLAIHKCFQISKCSHVKHKGEKIFFPRILFYRCNEFNFRRNRFCLRDKGNWISINSFQFIKPLREIIIVSIYYIVNMNIHFNIEILLLRCCLFEISLSAKIYTIKDINIQWKIEFLLDNLEAINLLKNIK